jgi:PAS domain S-box-containing protein
MVPLALAAALLGGYLFYRLVVAPLQELGQATVLALQPEGTFRLDPAAPGCREIRQARAGAFQLFRQLGSLVQERTARLEEALQQSAERQQQLAATEREARSNEARFTEVFRTTSSGLLLTDGTGRVLLANPAAEQILRSGQQQAVGRDLIDLLVGGGFASDRRRIPRRSSAWSAAGTAGSSSASCSSTSSRWVRSAASWRRSPTSPSARRCCRRNSGPSGWRASAPSRAASPTT